MSMKWWIALFAAGCAAGAPRTEAPRAPATLALEVVSGEPLPGTRMELRARLDKHGVWDAPVTMDVRVPAGARLLRQSAVSGESTFEIELTTVPVEDLVVVADSQTEGAGFHAEARYRFGRPEPVKSGPAREGDSVTTPAGADLGQPVKMK